METITKGIVIKRIDYGETDIIATILGPKKIYSFIAQGIRKPQSKNQYALVLGSLSEFIIFEARLNTKVSKLKKATPIINFDITNSENRLTMLKILHYLEKINTTNLQFFKFLESIWDLWGQGNNYLLLSILINKMLQLNGIYPNYNQCIECQTTENIADFKYHRGGFLCYDHKNEILSLEELQAYFDLNQNWKKYLYNTKPEINQKILKALEMYWKENNF
ncbi:DNA repair protein RecO [Candidatus Mycoplasma pogonae]